MAAFSERRILPISWSSTRLCVEWPGMKNAVRTAASLLLLAASAASQQKEDAKPLQKWDARDYGSFHSSSVTMPWSKDFQAPDGITIKAVTVKLGGATPASVCFDTNLCRMAAGWTGGFL